ncbi:uncharacterized protein [Primulina huaijiensis]|uniref:uncharacterized protein n=1 Tax=Primulina huaijiensis TaxID=1492673 RepID=UPI003CC768BE
MGTLRIDVFGILESNFDVNALNSMLRVRFQGMNVVHNFQLNSRGRIFVLWNPNNVDPHVIGMSEQHIHVRITCHKTKFGFLASFVYGFNTICQRRILWNDVTFFCSNCHAPWIRLGDFNNVLAQQEKKGGLQVKNYEIKDFVTCVNSIDLSDLSYVGCFYTWSSPTVCSKLDGVLFNNAWLTSNVNGIAEFVVPGCVSDHSLAIVSFLDNTLPKKRPFKFFNMWVLNANFESLVQSNWKRRDFGTAQFRLKQLFNSLKRPLQRLNQNHFSHISARATQVKKELMDLQGVLLTIGVMQDRYKETKRKVKILLEAERLFIAQKAKIKYTQQGDRCTKFFHDLIKRNNKRIAIVAIRKADGRTTMHQDCWQELTSLPTQAEVVEAVFDIDNDKAPGLDGYSSFFFKSSWHIIGEDVFNAVLEFFKNGRKRGLRQGDPLFPYLFALCIEVLSRELKMMARNQIFGYLGVPLASKQLRASDYSPLVDTISTKISSWPRHSLSYAGKLELIRSVVQGIECFWLSILLLPLCVIDAIYSLCWKFVWPTKHPPIAWHTLCKPIEAGGLGLKNLKAWNKALLAKTLWNIHNKKDSLCIKWINHVYSHVPNVWSWVWKKRQSPLIKNLIIIRDNLISAHGSAQASIQMLDSWFGVSKGLNRACDFFVAQQHRWPWKPLISKSCILPKHKFILWLLAHRKLLTRDILEYLEDKSCALCNVPDETINHLFFACPITRVIWSSIRSWLHMRKIMGSPSSILAAFRGIYRGSSTINKMKCVALAATVYHTWNIRNKKVFENQLSNINAAVMKIKSHVFRTIDNAAEVIDYLH